MSEATVYSPEDPPDPVVGVPLVDHQGDDVAPLREAAQVQARDQRLTRLGSARHVGVRQEGLIDPDLEVTDGSDIAPGDGLVLEGEAGSVLAERPLADVGLPDDCLVLAFVSNGHITVPTGRSRASVGDDHPRVLTATHNLGAVYLRQERYPEAERMLNDGDTTIGGRVPVNPSGGLACFGEAVPAQAIAQVCELTWHLRGQAGERQVEGAKAGITANQGLFGHGSSVIVTK